MSGHREEIYKKSSVPGVIITQFVKEIPKGCSTPDFVQKPVSVTLQEGKNAIFRAVVKGIPAPEVKWTRTKGKMGDPARCETFFNTATSEFILQIKNLSASDSDLYRCCAVNEYGEASCSVGLRIIQVGFKRKTKYVPVHPADVLKQQLEASRKMLKRRPPPPKQKALTKEQVWQLLLHADRRDYEKICLKYGIVDFRGMLKKLQELRKDTESEQEQLLHSVRNFEHIRVDNEGKATFSLEMDLKDSNSKIYLLKDGERLRYGTGDEYRKHYMKQIGKKYCFVINDVRPEDAGVYQVRVEDVPVFSTALDPEAIPVRFEQPLSDVRCLEKEDAHFECILRTPCHNAVWLHKTQVLQNSDKHQISVSPDGLTHKLTVKNTETSDNGMYVLSTGTCTSKAWLLVEYAKGKRKQDEEGEGEESNWLKETLPDKDRAKKPRAGDDHLMDTGMGGDGWARSGQRGSEGHSIDADGSQGFLGKEGHLVTNDGSVLGLGDKSGLGPFHGKDSVGDRAGTGGEFGGAGSVDGRGGGVLGGADVDMDGEGMGSQYDKDGKLGGYRAGVGGAGGSGPADGSSVSGELNPDLTGMGAGKGDLFSRTGPGAGNTAAGMDVGGGMKSSGKDDLLTGAGINREGQQGTQFGKDGQILHSGGHLDQTGKSGLLYGPDGLPAGDQAIAGAGASSGEMGALYGPDGRPIGAGAGVDGVAGAGGAGSPYGKDGLPAGAGAGGAGVAGAGAAGSPYGKDGLPAGAGAGGAGVAGAGAAGSPYGKDGLPAGAGAGGAGVAGAGAAGSPYGKDGSVAGGALGGAEGGMGSQNSRDASLGRAEGEAGGDGFLSGDAFQGGSAGARAGVGAGGRLGADDEELGSVYGKEGVGGAAGQGGLDSHSGKASAEGETGKGTASDLGGSGKNQDKDAHSGQGDARGKDGDLGGLGSFYDEHSASGRVGKSAGMRSSGGFGQGSSHLGQTSSLFGGPLSINQRIKESDLEIKANDFLRNTESTGKRRNYTLDNLKAPRCFLSKGLHDITVLKGESAELSFTVSKHDVTGTWYKDGLKLTSMDGVVFKKEGLVHKLIINKVEDIHAGKYRFQGGDIKTEANIFVEDPPQVDQVLLKNLTSIPTVAKAGQKVQIRIPFQGRLPMGAVWLKDRMELMNDTRIRVDKTDTFTMLSISSCERKDCGDYKVRLKNDSGVLEINLKVVVVDKPQPPVGPIKIIENSGNSITIAWKPPKDDGGKPVQSYIVESQQVGKGSWVALGETPRTSTTFTTNKVEPGMSYYFRVRAVNAEGSSDALESEEVKTDSKASPGAPDPPEVVSTSRDSITISWKAPRKAGSSQIVGYMVQKRQKGRGTWLLVNKTPIKGKQLKVTNLKKGLQYEFRVAAVNAAGTGDASEPSQPAIAQDTKSLGQVRDLKVSSSDSSSLTLTWKSPEVKDGNDVRGYEVEMRPSKSLSWTKCNALPITGTTYTVRGLQVKEKYFLRVRALSESGPGEAAEIEGCIESAALIISPRFLIDGTVKSSLIVKAGDTLRVKISFEAAPNPEVTWLKDGIPFSKRTAISTEDDATKLLIRATELTDSGTYTIELRNGLGEKETFTFQVQVKDIPQPPGPIKLEENVLNAVTVTWEPSASEKWESDLHYTVLKRESEKGLWVVVGDLIYNNKFTFTRVIPGQEYYFRVVAKNSMGASSPSETVKPWKIKKPKAQFEVRPPEYREVNQNQPPRFLVPLKPHVVTIGTECHMSCAVGGHPPPKVTWYKNSRDLSNNPDYFCINDFGVCSLVIPIVTKQDEGQYVVEAINEAGRASSRAFLTIKDTTP
ncbi:immunoglobulin-like and fibronectin type III domain-containing protein 1 isoform X3 [Calypte anna]|uniref:immunoglobulin-like and fibronectin type III domain-containing protein 1 isoform X3 n=1 Tax=Calypte anna TaxID=9244 RepID=UPI0011C3A2D0|nr:immunoglobulin-like and fibronectin type III domain-containing protein 1 isoform X3 [Calypte anna]